jgi:CO dehydrogenase/acetyl-CoA synthase delta subunit
MQIHQLVLLELEIIINFLKREQIIMKPKTCFIGTQIEFLDQFNYDVSFP